ncbi:MAG: mannosyltransferase family protein [Thermoanaerobaculia bacterium]
MILWAATRIGIALVAYLAVGLLPANLQPAPYHLRGTDNVLVDVFGSRWDTGFYVSIVEEGYILHGVELPSVAFFPLLPLLMALVRGAVGDAVVAGLLVTNASLLGASILFYRLVADELGEETADRATWYLLIFPASVFGSAIYTESVFLLAAVGALLAARRGRWGWAAVAGIASALARLHGVVVAAMLAVEWWDRRRRKAEPIPPRWGLLAAFATPLGTLSFMAYCRWRFGNALAFVEAASHWARMPRSPYETVREAFLAPAGGWWSGLWAGRIHLDNWIDLACVLLFLLLGCWLLAERRWSEGALVVLGVSLSFGSGLLMSQRRYVWVLFPAYALLARWGHREWVDRLVTVLFLVGLALATALFAGGYWVA